MLIVILIRVTRQLETGGSGDDNVDAETVLLWNQSLENSSQYTKQWNNKSYANFITP